MRVFEFESDNVFYIWGRGFSFQGKVLAGQIRTNEKVVIQTEKGPLYASVKLIVLMSKGTVIEESVIGELNALVLDEFSKEELNCMEQIFNPEEDEEPVYTEFLNVTYPILIQKTEYAYKPVGKQSKLKKWLNNLMNK